MQRQQTIKAADSNATARPARGPWPGKEGVPRTAELPTHEQRIPQMRLVQVLDGIGSVPAGEVEPTDPPLAVGQWEPDGDYFCELQSEADCDSATVSWGTSDTNEGQFCTKHFFSDWTGYEFVDLGPEALRDDRFVRRTDAR